MSLTTEDLCKILHYSLARESRMHGPIDLDLDLSSTWDESPREYKQVIRGAVGSLALVVRKDERHAYRSELMACMEDLARNPRVGE